MSDKRIFPEGFLWGAATASYQVEGGIDNTDWSEAARQNHVPFAGLAIDHYNRFEADFDLAKNLGHNCHRFSIEWARIEPEEGVFDEKEIEHYGKVLDALNSRGLVPFITLWHFTLPRWFSESGGFERKDSPEIFARYCAYVVSKLGNKTKFWGTMNEPMILATHGYLRGLWPPFKRAPLVFLKFLNNLVKAHKKAYESIKKENPNLLVGINKHNKSFEANWNPVYKLLARFLNWFTNERFLNAIKHQQDWIGINYYIHFKFGDTEKYQYTDMGWQIYPKGLYDVLLPLKKYKKPIYITECGIADSKDTFRVDFIKEHVFWMHKALEEGVPLKGFFYWSLFDNYEWAHGYEKRFGLVEIDYNTLERHVRPSAYAYKKIIELNGLDFS